MQGLLLRSPGVRELGPGGSVALLALQALAAHGSVAFIFAKGKMCVPRQENEWFCLSVMVYKYMDYSFKKKKVILCKSHWTSLIYFAFYFCDTFNTRKENLEHAK